MSSAAANRLSGIPYSILTEGITQCSGICFVDIFRRPNQSVNIERRTSHEHVLHTVLIQCTKHAQQLVNELHIDMVACTRTSRRLSRSLTWPTAHILISRTRAECVTSQGRPAWRVSNYVELWYMTL